MTPDRSCAWALPAVVSLVLTLGACGDAGGGEVARPGPGPKGEVAAGAALSCVEAYDLHTLTGRDFAFDGTVTEIGPALAADTGYSPVTFDVHEWYRGGTSQRVTVAMPDAQQVFSAGIEGRDDATYGIGTRLLVSGEPRWGGQPLDEPVAWMCGFTRYYDEQSADRWRTAFAP